MKVFLFILLLALTTSKFPDKLIEIGKCIIKSEKVRELIPQVLEAIRNKDFFSLFSTVVQSFPQIKAEIMECLSPEPLLGIKYEVECYKKCIDNYIGRGISKSMAEDICKSSCLVV